MNVASQSVLDLDQKQWTGEGWLIGGKPRDITYNLIDIDKDRPDRQRVGKDSMGN